MQEADRKRLTSLLEDASELYRAAAKKAKILAALSWDRSVSEEFFRSGESQLPKPTYNFDPAGANEMIERLEKFAPRVSGQHPVLHWLEAKRRSYVDGFRLLLSTETDSFFDLSTILYGNSYTRPFEGVATNLDLARTVGGRLGVCSAERTPENEMVLTASEFAAAIEQRREERRPELELRIELTKDIAAKVVAGATRVRLRDDALFSQSELRSLWRHEVESHALTAQNGQAQPLCRFLSSGGPRSTLTQEGLAVFFEVFGHAMSQVRFLRLCDRVEAVALAEQGANFIDVYRWFLPRCNDKLDAFFAAQRVFRGAKLEGGKPFTKDVVYLSGLVGVFQFLQLAVKNQNRLLVEALVCGRVSLEDVGVLAWLRTEGFVTAPKHLPDWLRNWEGLVTFFGFMALQPQLDVDSYQTYFERTVTLGNWDLSL